MVGKGSEGSRAPRPQISKQSGCRATTRKGDTHQQFFPTAAPVIKYNSPGAHIKYVSQTQESPPSLVVFKKTSVRLLRALYKGQINLSHYKFSGTSTPGLCPSLPIAISQSLVNQVQDVCLLATAADAWKQQHYGLGGRVRVFVAVRLLSPV